MSQETKPYILIADASERWRKTVINTIDFPSGVLTAETIWEVLGILADQGSRVTTILMDSYLPQSHTHVDVASTWPVVSEIRKRNFAGSIILVATNVPSEDEWKEAGFSGAIEKMRVTRRALTDMLVP